MTVHVRLFAGARDLAGADLVTVVLPCGATVADLRRSLEQEHPRLSSLLARSAIAVNHDFAGDHQLLTESAEVALLPPVSGG
jgi:molybdopterin converting factor subunit 1